MRSVIEEAKQYTGVYRKPRLNVAGVLFLALLGGLGVWHWRDAPGDLYKIGEDVFACPDRASLHIAESAKRAGDGTVATEAGCVTLRGGTDVRKLRGTIDADLMLHWRIQTPDGQALWIQRGWLRNPDGSLIR
jgi:hypothetical protein